MRRLLLVAFASVAWQLPAVAAETYESTADLHVADFLAADVMAGPDWQLEALVQNDGFDNIYTLTSRFGTLQASGKAKLAQRVLEIRAMAQLEQVASSDVFVEAVKNSVTAPIDLVASVATRPVQTIAGMPMAVGRWFRTMGFRVSETFNDVSRQGEAAQSRSGASQDVADLAGEYALDFMKISKSERQWYARLGVDPNTDNQPLRDAIRSVAQVQGLTSFGMKFVSLPSIPASSEIRTTMNMVWETDPWELRRQNREKMLQSGLSQDTARAFESNPALTLTTQTALLNTLDELAGVAGRSTIIARAIDAQDRDEASHLLASTILLARLHAADEPLQEILPGTHLPVARTASGGLVAALAVDAMYWTSDLAESARAFAAAYADRAAASRTLWITGKASSGLASGVGALGWSVHDQWQTPATPAATATQVR